jgi:hypothetical protein
MRRLTFMAALGAALALAGCTLKTPEGATCDRIGGVDQCPEGQRCGADGRCSVAAMACGPSICTASSCSGQPGDETLSRCDQSGVCASLTPVQCNAQQTCDPGAGQCDCVPSAECTVPMPGKVCSAGVGETLITCSLEGPCPYKSAEVGCALGEDCVDTFPNARCECPEVGDAEGAGCDQADFNLEKCTGQVLLTCARRVANSQCFTWQLVYDCSIAGLLCNPGAQGACVCPAHLPGSKTLRADPGATIHPGTEPNGMDPLACRFRTLGEAIANATDGDTVKAMATAVDPFREPGFTIKSRVAVVGDQSIPAQPGNVVVELNGTGTQGVVVESEASLSGVTVRRSAGAAAATGIEIRGASPIGGASLADVVVDKDASTDAFATGVLVSGTGTVLLRGLTLLDMTGSGLEIARVAVTDTVAVTALLAKRNAVGINLKLGDATLTNVIAEANLAQGVVATNASVGRVGLGLSDSSLRFNGEGGLSANRLTRFHLERTVVCGNSASLQDVPGIAVQRRLGGVTLGGTAPADQLIESNVFHDNSGDQVALIGPSGQAWNLSAAICGAMSNVFAGYATSQTAGVPDGTGLLATGVSVTVTRAGWPQAPAGDRDFLESTPGLVNADGGAFQYCTLQQVTPVTTCPPVPATP